MFMQQLMWGFLVEATAFTQHLIDMQHALAVLQAMSAIAAACRSLVLALHVDKGN